MSFRETDFPGLIKYLKKIVDEEKDPILVKELVSELVKLYEDIPVYPGIVNMCLGGIAKAIKPEDIQIGQKIFIKNRDECVSGTVTEKDGEGIVLKAAKLVTSEDEIDLGFREIEKVVIINNEILKETWPSLVFAKEQK